MRKRITRLALFVMFAACLVSCGAEKQDMPAEKEVENALTEAAEWDRYDLSMVTQIRVSPKDADSADDAVVSEISGSGAVIREPYKSRFTFSMLLETVGQSPVLMEQYMEASEDGYTVYQSADNIWLKYTMKEEDLKEAGDQDPLRNLPLMAEHLVSAEKIGYEPVHGKEAIRYAVIFEKEVYQGILTGEQLMGVEIDQASLNVLGYDIWIDGKTGELLKYETDFSEAMEKIDRWDAQMSITVDIYEHGNAVLDFEIPEEARQAREVAF